VQSYLQGEGAHGPSHNVFGGSWIVSSGQYTVVRPALPKTPSDMP